MPGYGALLASHGRMTAIYKDLGAVVVDEQKNESCLYQQLGAIKI
jgi:hypothetical protein